MDLNNISPFIKTVAVSQLIVDKLVILQNPESVIQFT